MYLKSLVKAELVSEAEAKVIESGLTQIFDEWTNKTFKIFPSDEDIHSAIERRLKVLSFFYL